MLDRIARAASILGGLAALVITLLISYDVLMRYLFDQPQLFVDEAASFLLVLVIFSGLAHTFIIGGHVRVDLLTSHLPDAVRAWLRVVTLALGVALFLLIIWVTTVSAITAYRYDRVSAVMLYPLWLPMTLIPAGLALMVLAMMRALVRQLRAALGPRGTRQEVA